MTQSIVMVHPDDLRALVHDAVRDALAHSQPAQEWLNAQEACDHFKCSKATLYRAVNAGKIEAKGAGKLRRFKAA